MIIEAGRVAVVTGAAQGLGRALAAGLIDRDVSFVLAKHGNGAPVGFPREVLIMSGGGTMDPDQIDWAELVEIKRVEVEVKEIKPDVLTVTRKVTCRDKKKKEWSFDELVSPIYVPGKCDDKNVDSDNKLANGGNAMAEFQKHWSERETQARTTAKWIATSLGVALAALVGTAPLSGLSKEYIPREAYIYAAEGLILIGITIFFVVRVLVPKITGFGDLLDTWRLLKPRTFKTIRKKAESHSGVMLPTGIKTLAELAWRAELEAKTLNVLATCILRQGRQGSGADEKEVSALQRAQRERGHWLDVLTTELTQWTTVAAYEVVRKDAWWARTFGLAAGVVGTAAIIGAFTLLDPKIAPASLQSYSITMTPESNAREQALKDLGPGCTAFKGVITSVQDSDGTVGILVEPIAPCRGGLVKVPIANLEAVMK
jgi:hypothetical protein